MRTTTKKTLLVSSSKQNKSRNAWKQSAKNALGISNFELVKLLSNSPQQNERRKNKTQKHKPGTRQFGDCLQATNCILQVCVPVSIKHTHSRTLRTQTQRHALFQFLIAFACNLLLLLLLLLPGLFCGCRLVSPVFYLSIYRLFCFVWFYYAWNRGLDGMGWGGVAWHFGNHYFPQKNVKLLDACNLMIKTWFVVSFFETESFIITRKI